jgi:hypothetical protein
LVSRSNSTQVSCSQTRHPTAIAYGVELKVPTSLLNCLKSDNNEACPRASPGCPNVPTFRVGFPGSTRATGMNSQWQISERSEAALAWMGDGYDVQFPSLSGQFTHWHGVKGLSVDWLPCVEAGGIKPRAVFGRHSVACNRRSVSICNRWDLLDQLGYIHHCWWP